MVKFDSISGFKRNLGVGKKLHAVNHRSYGGRYADGSIIYEDKDMGVRAVSIVQSNSFALKTKRTDGTEVDSWCAYPKASECIIRDNSLVILEEDNGKMVPVLTYRFVD
jgi:hypothetical protein